MTSICLTGQIRERNYMYSTSGMADWVIIRARDKWSYELGSIQ